MGERWNRFKHRYDQNPKTTCNPVVNFGCETPPPTDAISQRILRVMKKLKEISHRLDKVAARMHPTDWTR